MKTVELNIDNTTKPQNLAVVLKKKDLQRGDTINVESLLDEEMVLLIVLITLMVLHKTSMNYADTVLKDIFGNKNSKQIQKEIENKYGIEVELKTINEEKSWQQFSKEKLSTAYDLNEPEYDPGMVKETRSLFQ